MSRSAVRIRASASFLTVSCSNGTAHFRFRVRFTARRDDSGYVLPVNWRPAKLVDRTGGGSPAQADNSEGDTSKAPFHRAPTATLAPFSMASLKHPHRATLSLPARSAPDLHIYETSRRRSLRTASARAARRGGRP